VPKWFRTACAPQEMLAERRKLQASRLARRKMVKQLERHCREKEREGHEAAEQYKRVLAMYQAAVKRKGEDLAAVDSSFKAADAAYKPLYAAVSGRLLGLVLQYQIQAL
jgi:uncharacterized hydantoinase/oxoprolinase family protein